MIMELRDEVIDVKTDNLALRQTVQDQLNYIHQLEREIDDLNQYGRRENVCFSNLLIDEDHTADQQVIDLCNEIGVEVKTEDLVDCHPLPAKRGNQVRVIARFKDRRLAQKVFKNRKNTKTIDRTKKEAISSNKEKGFAIQPNITPRRAALLGQVLDAKTVYNYDSCWVDYKNGNIMLRKDKQGRPYVISCTNDIIKALPGFKPNEYFFCSGPDEVFDISMIASQPELVRS